MAEEVSMAEPKQLQTKSGGQIKSGGQEQYTPWWASIRKKGLSKAQAIMRRIRAWKRGENPD